MTHDNTNTQTFRKIKYLRYGRNRTYGSCDLHSRTIICSNWSGANFTY
mgnify:CR=1 FL=1